jgi:hypothetical protein
MATGPAGTLPDLVESFFVQARAVFLGEAKYEALDANDILEIAADPAASANFARRFAQDTQNKDFQKLVVDYMQDIADNLEDIADKSEIDAQMIDKMGLPAALSIGGVGIAAIVGTGGAFIPIVVTCGGLLGLAAAGIGGATIKRAIWKRKVAAKKIRKLVARLR